MTQLANKYRPRTFAEVVGQESEARVIKAVIAKRWRPSAILANGPFGTGKTTFARLIARAMLCNDPKYGEGQTPDEHPYEPCGICQDCRAMDTDSHPNYIEVDAASNGLIADVRQMKDQIAYRTGGKTTIIT
jgi:DNA polymerase-3 subunit gamma/tau